MPHPLAFALYVLTALPLAAFETGAKAAYVMDMGTGTVLLSKNADAPLPPASMSKLMTLYIAFEAVRDGLLRLDEELPVSAHAMSYGGSTMFLNTRDRVAVQDLLRGIVVLSGNDACAVIAEALSPDGTEAGFARMMTRRGQELGLTQSTFTNSNGWPAPGHRMSMRDLAIVAQRLIQDFPEFYPLFSEREFAFDGRAPANRFNRNPLLELDIGADGLKTGRTQEAGFGLTGSARQGDRRIVFVISGLESAEARAQEAEAIVNWAFRQFVSRQVARKGERLAVADVWMGATPTVGLVSDDDVTMLLPVIEAEQVKAEIVYKSPIQAPIRAGDQIGELVIAPEGLSEHKIALVADGDVPVGGFMNRLTTAAVLLVRHLRSAPLAEDPA